MSVKLPYGGSKDIIISSISCMIYGEKRCRSAVLLKQSFCVSNGVISLVQNHHFDGLNVILIVKTSVTSLNTSLLKM